MFFTHVQWVSSPVSYDEIKAELKEAKKTITDLEGKLELHREATNKMADELLEWHGKADNEHFMVLRLEKQVDDLSKALSNRFKMPDFSEILKNVQMTIVDPPNEKPYNDKFLAFQYNIETQDDDYYAFPKQTWMDILTTVYPLVKKALRYASNVSDCENWAQVTGAFTAIGISKAGLNKQGALAIGISRGHAYNVFMTPDKHVWIWEPQNASLLGEIIDDIPPLSSGETYETIKLRYIT